MKQLCRADQVPRLDRVAKGGAGAGCRTAPGARPIVKSSLDNHLGPFMTALA
jgi:hypothetical protein